MTARHLRAGMALAALVLLISLLPIRSAAQITPLSVPDLPPEIPLLPLPNVAVLPFLELPIRIVEPRYREMLADALAGPRVIGVVQIQPGFEGDALGMPPIFSVGSAAIVVRSEARSDGTFDVVVRAFSRFRVTRETSGRTYRTAAVEPISEGLDDEARVALTRERPALVAAMAASLGVAPEALRLPPMSNVNLVNSLVMTLDMDVVDRQLLIEQPGVLARARKLIELLTPPERTTPPVR